MKGLEPFFTPRTVAVIGATEREGSVGQTLMRNLCNAGFAGEVIPVNPTRSTVMGLPAIADIRRASKRIDLAVIATAAASVPEIVAQCAQAAVRGVVIISAGFKETGAQGAALERRVVDIASQGGVRIIGPNCLGVMNPRAGLNATFASAMALPGNLAFVSQSGALCTAVLDWSLREQIGFSAFISIGSMLDVGWGDLIDYLGDDPATKSILLYMESIGDARSFLSAAREVALSKPIIVIKAGRSPAAAKAAASHTGALAGADDVLDAAFSRVGVLRVDEIEDLFFMAQVLAKQPRPSGHRLMIVTNAGGPGVLATDALVRYGGEPAALSPRTLSQLDAQFPPHWSRGNPIDVLGDASPARYAHAVSAALDEENTDGLLVVLTPQAMTDPTQTAKAVTAAPNPSRKPVFASWMGGSGVAEGEEILKRAGIPTFPYPDAAVRMFCYMCRYNENLKSIYQTPSLVESRVDSPGDLSPLRRSEAIIKRALDERLTTLSEAESKEILAAYGLPVAPTQIARTSREATAIASQLGFPVVLKLHSRTITHKAAVGGVELDLRDATDVDRAFGKIQSSVTDAVGRDAFEGVSVQPMIRDRGIEVIVGSTTDPQFGPVILFGGGGRLVETYQDRALALPPLNTTLANRLMAQTRIYRALRAAPADGDKSGRRGIDLEALEKFLVLFSRIVLELPRIRSIEVNPLLLTPQSRIVLDARVILHDPSIPSSELPRPAIRPYPSQYSWSCSLRNHTPVEIRPIRPEDEPLVVAFHGTLSEKSVYFRYLHPLKLDVRIEHERLSRICFNDYDRQIALVAVTPASSAKQLLIGIGRLIRLPGKTAAEFAVLIADPYQGQGLGRELLRRMLDVARAEKIERVTGYIHAQNSAMKQLVREMGFTVEWEDGVDKATIDLSSD